MKLFIRNALLATTGLVIMSLPAQAVSSMTLNESPLFVSKTTQMARNAGSWTDDGYGRMRDTASGSVGFKKSKAKKEKSK